MAEEQDRDQWSVDAARQIQPQRPNPGTGIQDEDLAI
jgi:hypothetical protein